MDNISIADIATLVGIFVLLYTKFFSKGDRQKLAGENDKLKAEAIKVEAETNKTEAETADKYEDVIKKLLDRNSKLDCIITSYDEKFEKINKRVADLEKDNRKLKAEIAKRDEIIDCFDVSYRELARKAIDAGVPNISIDAPCFKLNADEKEE
jgi:predicted RNase H-like nuclease (RuvC/YqgF family)